MENLMFPIKPTRSLPPSMINQRDTKDSSSPYSKGLFPSHWLGQGLMFLGLGAGLRISDHLFKKQILPLTSSTTMKTFLRGTAPKILPLPIIYAAVKEIAKQTPHQKAELEGKSHHPLTIYPRNIPPQWK